MLIDYNSHVISITAVDWLRENTPDWLTWPNPNLTTVVMGKRQISGWVYNLLYD